MTYSMITRPSGLSYKFSRPSGLSYKYSRPSRPDLTSNLHKPIIPRSVSPITSRLHNDLICNMNEIIRRRCGSCMCERNMHMHGAITFIDSGSKIIPITYGENMIRDTDKSIHAEHNAILKLPQRYSRKLLQINIFVIKTTLHGVVGMSKPCAHCLTIMTTLPQKLGYRIANIFYTNRAGDIEKKKLNELLGEDMHVSKLFTATGYKVRPISPTN